MNLSDLSIRRPVTIFMLAIAVLMFGFVSLPRLAVELMPELNLPVAVVVTSVEGGAPAEVEKLVTKPIEEALGSVSNVDKINSVTMSGASQVIVQFNWGTNMDQAMLDIRDKIDQVRGALPDSAKSPRVLRFDPNSMPIVTLGLTGDNDTVKLKSIADNTIKSRLERVDGVASVMVTGGKDRLIDVVLDPSKIAAYGLTIDQIQQALGATNQSGSAGAVRQGETKLNIRVQGEYQSVDAIGDTPIHVGSGSIRLKDIAQVNDTYKEVTQEAYLNGEPTVGISVLKASGGNTIEVVDGVRKELTQLEKDLPDGLKVTMIMDTSQFIKDSIYTLAEHALFGGLFAILILMLFLNSVRSVIIVAIVIPISIIATFCLMYFTGETINLITLSGLTLGLGSLVDFAVVILENIFRHRQAGKGMLEAAKLGAREVGNAVAASALAQICVFLPIVFVDGLAAQIFKPLALTVVFSHIAAFVASITLVPMLSSLWLKKIPDHEEGEHTAKYRGINPFKWFNIGFNKMARGYGRLLKWALGHRKTVFVLTLAMFVGAVALVPFVGAEFIPAQDEGRISISITMPNGTVLEETSAVVKQVEDIVKKIPELKLVYSSAGSGGSFLSATSGNLGSISVELVPKTERKRSTLEVVEELRKQVAHIPGPEIVVKEDDQGMGGSGSPVQITLHGDDLDVLKDISEIIEQEVKAVPGTRNVSSSLDDSVEEFQVVVDHEKASLYGLTTSQIISNVRTAFQGSTMTKYRTGDDEIDVRVTMPKDFQEERNYLDRLRITTASGAQIPLSSVASIKREEVPQKINRSDQSREVTISSDIAGRDLNSIVRDITVKLDKINLPDGYSIQFGGQSEDMAKSFISLFFAIIMSIALIYMVMAGQFESLYSPFIIMFSIPPTLIGVVVGLFLTGTSLSVTALIGYILLVGIVVNNAIVLIDYVNNLRKKGFELKEAILQAGPLRLRPILMTSLATILAILPMAFGGGSGNESQAPMAIVVAFGLSFSTLITLVLVPVVYTWFDDWGKKLRSFRLRRRKKADSPAAIGSNVE
ncbi:efflux RND transporter permease subunit [Brevibacillus massiliensis]|uniref:efflux RND transporter permease subunit n=1 Tax=Brevibacillus massiliensis TaxID=1118054 RepID=UPI0002E18FF8|nr:efflux RND transporter permease subunit [Brevibacillus massiliensis]